MILLWSTRGRHWGFRFLIGPEGDGDPLVEYERMFAGLAADDETVARVGDRLALRFLDPQGRQDRSGRTIPHEFVIGGPLAQEISSVEDGIARVWPLVATRFARIWDAEEPLTT